MRIDSVEVSTHPRGWGEATDAPTFLPSEELDVALQPQSDSIITSAPRGGSTKRRDKKAAAEPRRPSQSTLKPRGEDVPYYGETPHRTPAPAPAAQQRRGPEESRKARGRSDHAEYGEPTPPTRRPRATSGAPSPEWPARAAAPQPYEPAPQPRRARPSSAPANQPQPRHAKPVAAPQADAPQPQPRHAKPSAAPQADAPQPQGRQPKPTPAPSSATPHGHASHVPAAAGESRSESGPSPLPAPPPAGASLQEQLAAQLRRLPPDVQAHIAAQLQAMPPEMQAQVAAQLHQQLAAQAAAQAAAPASASQPAARASASASQSAARASASASQPKSRHSSPTAQGGEPRSRPSHASAESSYREMPAFIPFEGGASFDPLAIPLPPEVAPPVYNWLRRLALQADLAGADRLLRDAIADLTNALSVMIIYADGDGLHSLGANDELPKDPQPIIQVAKARRALVGTHTALIPITTSTETIAVIQLARNARQPEFNMIDHVTMAALARESAAIMHHLVVEHLQRRVEQESDKRSLYRAEALESHRNRGQEGVLTELSPSWIRISYYFLCGAISIALVFATLVTIPTYSTGQAVIYFPGARITAPAPGQVAEINVKLQQKVHKGDLLVRLSSAEQEANLEQAKNARDAAIIAYLVDMNDEMTRKGLVDAQLQLKRAQDAVDQRMIIATEDGTVEEIPVQINGAVNFGDPVITIVRENEQPEVWAFLPGADSPRLKKGMDIQLELANFQKVREKVGITEVEKTTISGSQAKKMLGITLGESLRLPPDGNFVMVKGTLRKKQFRAKGKTYYYHHGMNAKAEVRVESKRFIVTLLPSLEKYVD